MQKLCPNTFSDMFLTLFKKTSLLCCTNETCKRMHKHSYKNFFLLESIINSQSAFALCENIWNINWQDLVQKGQSIEKKNCAPLFMIIIQRIFFIKEQKCVWTTS